MVNIYNLVVETTQKCNLKCSHCLRGAARNVNLDINKFQSFLYRNVESVGTLTIGGGEPALAIEEIDMIRFTIINTRTNISNVFLVTNGMYKTEKLSEAFLRLSEVCNDNEVSGFTFSFDHWHNEAVIISNRTDKRLSNYYKIQELLDYTDIYVKKHSDESWNNQSLIKMGRAIDNGYRELKPTLFETEMDPDGTLNITEGELYLNAKGEIYSDCNLSYKEMTPKSDFFICHYNENLADKLREYNEKLTVKLLKRKHYV